MENKISSNNKKESKKTTWAKERDETDGKKIEFKNYFNYRKKENVSKNSIVQKTVNKDEQIKEKKSGEVVRQFPPEELLNLRTKIEDLVGMIFDEKA